MIEPGKYDDETSAVREAVEAKGVILVVFDGDRGSGFSVQADILTTLALPKILRSMADEIEKDLPK